MRQDHHERPLGIEQCPVRIFTGTSWQEATADVVREVHLEVYLDGRKMVTIACTGLHTEELAVGWLRGEGIIRTAREIEAVEVGREGRSIHIHTAAIKNINSYSGLDRRESGPIPDFRRSGNDGLDMNCCPSDKPGQGLAAGQPISPGPEPGPDGGTVISSSGARSAAPGINASGSEMRPSETRPVGSGAAAGVGNDAGAGAGAWGAEGEETVQDGEAIEPLAMGRETISPARIFTLMEELVAAALIHNLSRGTHGAALADSFRIFVTREDIGRHNCLDMLSGYTLLHGIDGADKVLLRTGRVSSEIVYKVWRMGVPVVLSLSVPTAMAISLAGRAGITLVGAIRAPSLTVYTHGKRIRE